LTQIKLDYDMITTRDIELIFNHRGWLMKYFGYYNLETTETQKGYHVRFNTIKYVADDDVLLLQILLGSDIQREIYNFIRKYEGLKIETWNKLYTKKLILLRTAIIEERPTEQHCQVLWDRIKRALENCRELEGCI